MPVGNKLIRNLRRQAGISQRDFARGAKIDGRTLASAEAGGVVNVSTLEKIARHLSKVLEKDISIDDVTIETDERRTLFWLSDVAKEKLDARRRGGGFTWDELSVRTGLSTQTLHRTLDFDGPSNVSWSTAKSIADALDVPWSEISRDPIKEWAAGVISPRNQREKREAKLIDVADSIPDQNALIRFSISENVKLNLVPTLEDENDYDTIEALRSELIAEKGPIDHLKERYTQNSNVPQANLFGPLISKYENELSKDPRQINYTVLYARGARLFAARRKAAQQVRSGEWPDLDAVESDAIDAICDLHGPLIMASAVGRRHVADAHEFEATPEVYRKEEELLQEFGQALSREVELFEPNTLEAIEDITTPIQDDPQPARSRGAHIFFAGSTLSVIVGGAAWFAAGGVVATAVVTSAFGLSGAFLWEVAKKTDRFKNATDDLAKRADAVVDRAHTQSDQHEMELLKRMADFVDRKRDLFERVSNLRPEFGWVNRYLKKGANDEAEAEFNDRRNTLDIALLNLPIVMLGPQGSGKTVLGKMLAERLNVPFLSFEREFSERIGDNIAGYVEWAGRDLSTAQAQEIFTEVLSGPPTVIDLGNAAISLDKFWQMDTKHFLLVFLKHDSALMQSGNSWGSFPVGRTVLEINASNLAPQEILEEIMERLSGIIPFVYAGNA